MSRISQRHSRIQDTNAHITRSSLKRRAQQAAKRRREDREWAERSGPVITRAMTDEERERMRSRER